MKKLTQLNANYWNGKYYTSADHLNKLYLSGVISRTVIAQRSGLNWVEFTYQFATHYGIVLGDITKYSDHGFCSQAYGVEIPVNTLKSEFKQNVEFSVWERDTKILRRNKVIAKIALIERGLQAFQ